MQVLKRWSWDDWLSQVILGLIIVGLALALGGFPRIGLALAAGGLLLVIGGFFLAFVIVICLDPPVLDEEPAISLDELMEAFEEGRAAGQEGAELRDNPRTGRAYMAWRDGWIVAEEFRQQPPGPLLRPGVLILALLLPVAVVGLLCAL